MGKGNKIKPLVPPGKAPSKAAKPVTSLKLARKLTTSFHGLLHQEDLIKKDAALAPEAKRAKLKEIEQQIFQMGGREAYQEASALATKNFRSSRYVYKTLMKYGLQPRHGEPHLRVLEIGAVNGQLAVSKWMKVRAIDLLSRDTKVEQKDFFHVPVGSGPPGELPNTSTAESASSSSSSASSSAVVLPASVGASSFSGRDRITCPTTSRLHEVDWDTWAEKDKAAAAAAKGRGGGMEGKIGKKRQRSGDGDDDDDEDDENEAGHDGGGAAGASSSVVAVASSRRHASPAAVNVHINCPSQGYTVPVCGGYDVVVNAMVVNCVMDPIQRAEMLVKCRDHLVPGGLFYLALPSRCIDMSGYITRKMFEQLLRIIGFIKVDEKRTPKISFYMLRRADVTAVYSEPSASGSSSAPKSSAGSAKDAKQQQPLTGFGKAWKPIIVAQDASDAALLTRLSHNPPRQLPKGELPITGFSRTEFGMTVPEEWVLKGF